ncbi:MAG: hypothetical protein WB816_12375 [Methylocystis sp.]
MTAFPFVFEDFGTPLPFKVEANPDFPGEIEPVCIINNLGVAPKSDTFIKVGPPPVVPDSWEVTFRWATVGAPAAGTWTLGAFLQAVGPGPNLVVPGFPKLQGGINPQKFDVVTVIPGGPFPGVPVGFVHLYRLYAALEWVPTGVSPSVIKVAGYAKGPLIKFFHPA